MKGSKLIGKPTEINTDSTQFALHYLIKIGRFLINLLSIDFVSDHRISSIPQRDSFFKVEPVFSAIRLEAD
jgi:hypothetical protein